MKHITLAPKLERVLDISEASAQWLDDIANYKTGLNPHIEHTHGKTYLVYELDHTNPRPLDLGIAQA